MSYRFLRIFSYYPGFTEMFYAQQPNLAAQPYAEQLKVHMHNAFERSDFYSEALRAYGVETQEIVADMKPLQCQWARENDVTYNDANWMTEIVLAQITAYRPEVLFLNTWLPPFDAAFVARARELCPSIRLVLGWVGEAHPGAAYFAGHDLVLSCALDTVTYLQENGINARHLHHAFEPRILERFTPPATPTADLGFIGHIYFGKLYHNNRVRLFYEIAQQVELTVYGELSQVAYSPKGMRGALREGYYRVLEGLKRMGLDAWAQKMPRYAVWQSIQARRPYVPMFALLGQHTRPPVFGLEMFRTLAGFRMCLNAHGPSAYASNLRLYEATGVGTCLLTDWKPNLGDLFALDTEIVTYRSADEAVEKARYLLDHESERQQIAAAGQRRTLHDHTIAQRVEQLHALITERLAR